MTDLAAGWGQPASELPDLTKVETLKRYRGRVESVQSWRRDEGYDRTWERLRDMYRLRMFRADSAEDRILVAISFATINVIEPAVAINHPKFVVSAATDTEASGAAIGEAVLNYLWRHYDFQPEFRRAVKDFLVYGHGWIKVGYRYIEGEKPIDPHLLGAQVQDQLDQAHHFALNQPDLAAALPSEDEIIASVPTTETVTFEDRPFVERVSPFDVFVDPEATDIREAAWIAQRIVRPIEDVKRDKRYKQSVRSKMEADGSTSWHLDKSKFSVEVEKGRVTLWEFYDLKRNTVCVFTMTGDGFLVDPTELPYAYGHPFVMLRDFNVPDQFYPIGELEALEPLQNELNQTRSAMVRARKLDIRKYVAKKSALTPSAIDALKSDRDNTVVVIEEDVPLGDVIQPLPQINTRPELFQHSEQILNDFDRVSGVSEYQKGQLPEIRRTATEASIIQDAANARAADKLDTVQLACAQVGRRVLQLMQQYMTEQQTARITGDMPTAQDPNQPQPQSQQLVTSPDGKQGWFKFSREDIQGEFDFSVEAGSMQPLNEAYRRQSALQFLQVIGPFLGNGVLDPRAVAMHVLKDGFGLSHPEKFIMPPNPNAGGPQEKLIETIAYKDVPPDIQRQMEQQAGFQPSAYGSLPVDHVIAPDQQEQAVGNGEAGRAQQLKGQVGLNANQ